MKPLVSAVLTTYNRSDSAENALRSILAQDYPNMEVVVVEDGSQSGIIKLIDEVAGENVRYINTGINKGLAGARNVGLSAVRGEFIAFLDDDDEWLPRKISVQFAMYEKLSSEQQETVAAVQCAYQTRGGSLSSTITPLNSGVLKDSIVTVGIRTISSSPLFKTSALNAVQGFDETLRSSIDHDIWMKLAEAGYSAIGTSDALVTSHSSTSRPSMMSCSTSRLDGVDQFLRKWENTFCAWLGEKKGRRFVERYRGRVYAMYLASKVEQRNYGDIHKVVERLVSYKEARFFKMRIVFRGVVIGVYKSLKNRRA